MPIRQTMAHWHEEMIIPIIIKNGSQEIDKWRLYSRQCTSFAAFRLSSVNGFELPAAYGHAKEWGYELKKKDIV